MIEIKTKEELQEVIGKDELSVVKMGTEWCATCRSIQRQIEYKEQEYPKIKFYHLDLDKIDVIDEYGINELPALIAFKNGKEVSRKNEAELFDWLNFLSKDWVI